MFYLICEGGIHTVAYFHGHNVYPDKVIFDTRKVRDYVPYFDAEDDILILIHGLIQWSMSEVFALMHDVSGAVNFKSLRVLSDIDFKKTPIPYEKYSGDLFTATTKEKNSKGKIVEVGLMDAYLGYNVVKNKPDILEKEVAEEEENEITAKRKTDFEELSARIKRILPKYVEKSPTVAN
jgi:hypothetical protein